jgi:hypothetical protein
LKYACCIRFRPALSPFFEVVQLPLDQLAEAEVELGPAGGPAGLLQRVHVGDRQIDLIGGDVGAEQVSHQPRVARTGVGEHGLGDRVEQRQGLAGLAGFEVNVGDVADIGYQAGVREGGARLAAGLQRGVERAERLLDRGLGRGRPLAAQGAALVPVRGSGAGLGIDPLRGIRADALIRRDRLEALAHVLRDLPQDHPGAVALLRVEPGLAV